MIESKISVIGKEIIKQSVSDGAHNKILEINKGKKVYYKNRWRYLQISTNRIII